jgi:nicotinamide-nucleotide amidase
LEDYYTARGRVVDLANLKQALLPVGAPMIPNPVGTAPGFITTVGKCVVCSLSGVPREFKRMFADTVLPIIEQRAGVSAQTIARRTLKIFGLPESLVGSTVEGLSLPKEIIVSYRVVFPEVHLTLKSTAGAHSLDAAAAAVRAGFNSVGCIFSEDTEASVLSTVHALLVEKGVTVATAESCTGGMVGEYLTSLAGSSAYFRGGVLTYANDVKEKELGVPGALLAAHGAVSAEVVSVMAANARKRFDTDYAIAVSGVAGPSGGSDTKPVGTVYLGVASRSGVIVNKLFFASERDMIRRYAAIAGLDMLRRLILGVKVLEGYPVLSL